MSNKIDIKVGGIQYRVVSNDDEIYVRRLADEVNRHLDKLINQTPYLSTTMAAILSALNFCDEANKGRDELQTIKILLKKAEEETACAQLEAEEARRQVERLKQESARRSRPSDRRV